MSCWRWKKRFLYVISGLIVAILFIRFINLNADFPVGINWSGDIYTDEGGYSRNSSAYMLSGNWYVPGDFNPIINCPVVPIIQMFVFKMIGMNLITARGITVIFSIALVGVVFLFVMRHRNLKTAVLCTWILALNYYFFIYSRLALLEIPMVFFGLLSVYLISNPKNSRYLVYSCLSAAALTLCILTKSSGLFIGPVVVYAIFLKKQSLKRKIYQLVVYGATLLTLFSVYYLVLVKPFIKDYVYFNSLNLGSKLVYNAGSVYKLFLNAVYNMNVLDKTILSSKYEILVILCLILFSLLFKKVRSNFVFTVSLAWLLVFLVEISLNNYFPPRYYIPVIISFAILAGCICMHFYCLKKPIAVSVLLIILLSIYSLENSYMIMKYILKPEYSYYSMCNDIKKIVTDDSAVNHVLMGQLTNTITLQTGIFSINNIWGTEPLNKRIASYRPGYYVHMPGTKIESAELSQYYNIVFIKNYNVFHNYYTGKPVGFYRLENKITTH